MIEIYSRIQLLGLEIHSRFGSARSRDPHEIEITRDRDLSRSRQPEMKGHSLFGSARSRDPHEIAERLTPNISLATRAFWGEALWTDMVAGVVVEFWRGP